MDQMQSSCAGGANAHAEMASAGRQRDDGDQGTVYSVWRLSSARTTVALPSGPRSLALDMHHLCNLNYPAWVPACHVKTAVDPWHAVVYVYQVVGDVIAVTAGEACVWQPPPSQATQDTRILLWDHCIISSTALCLGWQLLQPWQLALKVIFVLGIHCSLKAWP